MSRRRPQSSSFTSTADPPRDSLLSPTSPPLPTSGDLPGTSWVMRPIYAAALWQYVPAAKAQTTETGEESSYISEQYNICKDDIGACSGLISECCSTYLSCFVKPGADLRSGMPRRGGSCSASILAVAAPAEKAKGSSSQGQAPADRRRQGGRRGGLPASASAGPLQQVDWLVGRARVRDR